MDDYWDFVVTSAACLARWCACYFVLSCQTRCAMNMVIMDRYLDE